MELRHLRYFVAVGTEQNFNRAARRIGVAQPALSRHMKALEADVGFQLFERLPRGVRLTPAGNEFLERVQGVLRDLDAACTQGRETVRGHSGVLRLADLASHEQIDALHSDRLDVGFLYATPARNRALHFVEIEPYTMLIAMPPGHPLARRRSLSLADLRDEEFVWFSRQRTAWAHDAMIAECLSKGFSPRIVHEADASTGMMDLIAMGMGVGFVHPTFEDRRPDLVFRRLRDLALVWPLYMVWRKDDRLPVVRRFVEAVLDTLSAHSKRRRGSAASATGGTPGRH